jgi:hypothetical protein
MTYQELDFFFPFFVFLYGALMTFVLNSPALVRLSQERFPSALVTQMENHRYLAVICLVVGSLWSLQNLWIG